MKFLKKIFSVLIIVVILSNITAFAWKSEENILKCSWKKWFELYKCEKKQVCRQSDFWKQAKKVVSLEKIYEKETSYNDAQKIYKFNQNSIYKCWVLNSQKKAFKQLNEKLIKSTDKTGILKTKVLPKIEKKLKKIDQLMTKNKCQTIKQKDKKKAVKKIVLDQWTLQYCNYKYFLKYIQYLEDNDLKKNFPEWETEISAKKLWEIIIENKNTIQNEIEHTDKMYQIAFETYTQYDSFIKIHIILELLKEDYRTLRDKLYQTLHPINQVIYKIINAQSK